MCHLSESTRSLKNLAFHGLLIAFFYVSEAKVVFLHSSINPFN